MQNAATAPWLHSSPPSTVHSAGDGVPEILLREALAATDEGITVADVRSPEQPIVYANAGFERLTGYSIAETVGRNCRFLQGPGTDRDAVERIGRAVRQGLGCTVELLNYRKNSEPFWNRLSLTPIRGQDGLVSHYVGVQSDLSARKRVEQELVEAKRALERANRRMKRSLEAAARIQRSLLPEDLPRIEGLETAWFSRPCEELAGDCLNLVPLDERRVAFYLLDVSGHGVPAALLSVTLSRILSPESGDFAMLPLRTSSRGNPVEGPAEVAAALNREFPLRPEVPQFFTLFYGLLDRVDGQLSYVSAGHPAAMLQRRDGSMEDLEASGPPIGLLPSARFKTGSVRLEPGSRLFVFSDGLIEAGGAAVAQGLERLKAGLEESRQGDLGAVLAFLSGRVDEWCGENGPEDDVSILALELARQEGRDPLQNEADEGLEARS